MEFKHKSVLLEETIEGAGHAREAVSYTHLRAHET